MEDIIKLARDLGNAIADSKEAKDLRQAKDALNAEEGLRDTLVQYQTQAAKMQQLEAENKIIEVEDKKTLRDLHEKLTGNETFKKFTAAQVNYVDLMNKVTQTIQQELAETEQM